MAKKRVGIVDEFELRHSRTMKAVFVQWAEPGRLNEFQERRALALPSPSKAR